MPRALVAYVRYVEAFNRRLGRVVMWMIFAMMGVLLYSAISRTAFNAPLLWVVEMSQFMLVAYYLLGGPYSMQTGDHVRMDLLYGGWSDRTKAGVDAFTVLFLIAYLGFLLYGGISSTAYAIEYGERSYSVWRPYMWPIKTIACIGIFLMLLQAIAELIRDVAKLRGEAIA
ncbi:MAG: TRAP transporter small permease subunit [Rubrimonas sp.]|uniref:TRAP transporter small permease subunit n=1 Tax=Rubrimonas sp. TaxID=2036015 RepID=UPI002FDEC4BD